MRPGQQNKRGRGRGSSSGGSSNGGGGSNGGNNNFNRKGGNPLSRSYDSSGPDVKIRGTAQHIAEKYSTLARDAHSAGDRVMAENYLQHAEHYYRIIAAAQAQMQDRFQNQERGEYQDRDGNSIDQDDMDQGDGDDLGYAPQPMMDDQPRREHNSGQNSGQHSGQNSGQNAGQNAGQNSGQNQGNQSGQDQQPRENRRDRNERRERRPERPDRPERQDRAERAPDQASEHVVEQPAAPAVEQPVAPTRTRQRAPQVTEAPVAVAPVVDGSGPQPDIEGTPVEVSVEEESQTEATPRRRRTAANRPRRQTRKDADAADGGDAGDGDDKPALAEAGE